MLRFTERFRLAPKNWPRSKQRTRKPESNNVIVRQQPNGELILIGQTDHSRLVGQLAAHWGNTEFAVPDPFDSMVRAATFHDYGWLRYETSPLINPETGEPYAFQNLPF